MFRGRALTVTTLLKTFSGPISVTWFLTLCETVLMVLIPMFMGLAIDGLLADDIVPLWQLSAILIGLTGMSVLRRIYDTRAYGDIRVELGHELVKRSQNIPVSNINARLGMSRELVDFLEQEVPVLMTSSVQLIASLIILFSFHVMLCAAALGAAILMLIIYGVCHGRFYRLNEDLNHQTERQVSILETRKRNSIFAHLDRVRKLEVRISDTEAYVYGAIFAVLLGFIVFNLWYSVTHIKITVGTIFAIISYSWEFVESSLVLPMALQNWSRLSEIMNRINGKDKEHNSAHSDKATNLQQH